MSMWEELTKDVVSACSGGDSHAGMVQSVIGMLNNPSTGGVQGLAQSFEQNGLGHLVQSWVGNGANLPVSADQVQQVFGNTKLAQLAQQAGIQPQMAASILASVLPCLIDKMTPNGQMGPAAGSASSLIDSGLNMLKDSFGH
jgi:uncharacterized protein YidB (DUF937 family)